MRLTFKIHDINSVASAGDHDLPVLSNNEEDTPLLPGRTRSWLTMRYGTTRKCVSNKAALLILLWSFVVGLLSAMLLNPEIYMRMFPHSISLVAYGVVVIFTCFFPLAGILADIKYGRYKTVVTSLFIVLVDLLLGAFVTAVGVAIILSATYNDLVAIMSIVSCVLGGILRLRGFIA